MLPPCGAADMQWLKARDQQVLSICLTLHHDAQCVVAPAQLIHHRRPAMPTFNHAGSLTNLRFKKGRHTCGQRSGRGW